MRAGRRVGPFAALLGLLVLMGAGSEGDVAKRLFAGTKSLRVQAGPDGPDTSTWRTLAISRREDMAPIVSAALLSVKPVGDVYPCEHENQVDFVLEDGDAVSTSFCLRHEAHWHISLPEKHRPGPRGAQRTDYRLSEELARAIEPWLARTAKEGKR